MGPITGFALLTGVKMLYDVVVGKPRQERAAAEARAFTERQNEANRKAAAAQSELQRQHNEELQRKRQEFDERQARIRREFDLELNKRNAELQRELAWTNHDYRLAEQESSFANQKELLEYKAFLDKWPMMLPVEMLRREHMEGDYVTLGVFLFKNRDRIDSEIDKFWDVNIYPLVEAELNEWVEDVYRNGFGIDNIKFYRDSFRDDNAHHGSLVDIVRYALRGLPTVILESNVLPHELRLSFTLWGLGDDSTKRYRQYTFRRESCRVKTENGWMSEAKCRDLADWICACFKMIIGCNFDAFNLAQYNKMPVFPEIAKYELERGLRGTPLQYEDLKKEFTGFYEGIYDLLLGPESSFAKDCVNNKAANAYALRLCYAEKLKDFVSAESLNKWLGDSVEAWCALRGEKPAQEWLQGLLAGKYSRYQYFDCDDEAYFKEVAELMSESGRLKSLCDRTVHLLNAAESAEDLFKEGRRLYTSGSADDKKMGLSLYRRAAEMGYASAQLFLANVLMREDAPDGEKAEAAKWYKAAAEQGNAMAQFKLGMCYCHGDGVEADKEAAVKWLTLAAEQGHDEAERRLGELKSGKLKVGAAKAEALLRAAYADKQVGERFEFGRYPQGADGDEKPITWRVLRRDSDGLLVIAEYGLDAKPYNESYCDITWSECTLRRWLNGEFMQKAFNAQEQALIETSRLANNAGPETEDRVFLLSTDEANGLFANNVDRIAKATAFAAKNGAYTRYSNSWWWLRSRDNNDNNSASVSCGGGISYYYRGVGNASGSVRPAFRIAL